MRLLVFIIAMLGGGTWGFAQTAATGVGTTSPHPSAVLDVNSTTGGVLIPRMTREQRDAIPNPAEGLEVYVTDLLGKYYFDGESWERTSQVLLTTASQIYSFAEGVTGTGSGSTTSKPLNGIQIEFNAEDANFAATTGDEAIRFSEAGTYLLEINGVVERTIRYNPQIVGMIEIYRNGTLLDNTTKASLSQHANRSLNRLTFGQRLVLDLDAGDELTFKYKKEGHDGVGLRFSDFLIFISK